MKQRLDKAIVERGLLESRSKAQELIEAKKVLVNDAVCDKAGHVVASDDEITLLEFPRYVSRGGFKLEAALDTLHLIPRGFVCADVGSSTGGFTDCLLQRHAKKVYAIDVGTGQLAPSLRKDKRVVVMEQTDIRNLSLPEKVDLSVVDVSFISLTYILKDVANITKDGGKIITLIKPQFEVGPEHILKHGIADPKYREYAIQKVHDYAASIGLSLQKTIESPIQGGDGNVEYLSYFVK